MANFFYKTQMDVVKQIAKELNINPKQVETSCKLLDEGATVPFIARYRKEMTDGLNDQQLRILEERVVYLRELNKRRESILESIQTQGKLRPELEKSIQNAETKTLLEDLYLPYKPKRRTKAQIAREAGLGELVTRLLADRSLIPEEAAKPFIDLEKSIPDSQTALEGCKQIVMEQLSENAELLASFREQLWKNSIMTSSLNPNQESAAQKFKDYFDYQEAINKIPSHRALAIFRGNKEKYLSLSLKPGTDEQAQHLHCIQQIIQLLDAADSSLPVNVWLAKVATLAWKVKLFTRIELDLKIQLREAAEQEAIQVFSNNLRDLLLSAPAGSKVTLGLDPGIRTGVKVAIIDETGKLLDVDTIYPFPPKNQRQQSLQSLARLIRKHSVNLISIGNGTGSRETDQLIVELKQMYPELKFHQVITSEAGASVYSASETAANEFPDLDVTLRGAVSIARRLQDPLAELVKIEPKSIGVGQYQHDVNQSLLGRSLNAVVEDCVNAVGVDVNTASAALLKYVSGLNGTISDNIVEFRNSQGAFNNRKELKKVPRLGNKAFEQAAAFLRIRDGENPLDASAVHPEAYSIVKTIMQDTGKKLEQVMGHDALLKQIDAQSYTNEKFGLPTITDIINELSKPGRDPRPDFKTIQFKEGVETINDVSPGMQLEGIITNVANFGAFVDIGVHQDGLVHISQLANDFVKDPRDVVKTGDMVKVTVLEVDQQRQRISLSMKSQNKENSLGKPRKKKNPVKTSSNQSAMADALSKALR